MKRAHRHIHTITHKNIYKHLCENLDSQLDSEQCKRIREHIEGCDNCHALLDSLKKTVYLYKELPTPVFPKKLDRELFAIIKLESKKRKKSVKK